MRTRPLVISLLLLVGCSADPWDAYPSAIAPDRQCRTGDEAGRDFYVWDCVDGARVAVSQYCAGMTGCRDAERETGPCGEPTPMERRHADELSACTPPPPGRHWR